MKKIVIILSMVMTSVLIFSCSSDSAATTPTPTVDFFYSGANAPAPALVSFTSATTDVISYLWDFGDNTSSTNSNPQHTYATGGTYTVKLVVTGAGGTTSITKTVNVAAALTKVKITKVTLVSIPFTTTGGTSGWDFDGSGPDVYFQIQDVNSYVLFDATSSSAKNNMIPSSLPSGWNLNTPFLITDLTQLVFIQLYDDDYGTADEDMSYVGFLMSNYTTGTNPYPTTVTQTRNGITITLNLTWY